VPALPYVLPFGVVILLLAVRPLLPLPPLAEQAVWTLTMTATLALVARPAMHFRIRNWGGSVLMGIVVFAIWIGPDLIFPGYHARWLFTNPVTGAIAATMPDSGRRDVAVLALRTLRAALFVPIAEELFWRGWLMRWIITAHFEQVPLGAWSARAFWIVAVLFAAEHGPRGDVGLAAGALYNWWMVRTRNLGDCILAHAVTNACLCGYVIAKQHWEYWL